MLSILKMYFLLFFLCIYMYFLPISSRWWAPATRAYARINLSTPLQFPAFVDGIFRCRGFPNFRETSWNLGEFLIFQYFTNLKTPSKRNKNLTLSVTVVFFFFSLTWKVDEICPSLSPFLRLIKWMASKSRQDSWNHTSAFWMFLGHFWFKGKPSLIFCMETSSPNIISWALLYSRALQDSKISMQTSDPMWCCNLRRLKRYRNLQTRKHEQRKKTWKHRLTSQSTVSHTNVKCN